jgi:hypothetical protein
MPADEAVLEGELRNDAEASQSSNIQTKPARNSVAESSQTSQEDVCVFFTASVEF